MRLKTTAGSYSEGAAAAQYGPSRPEQDHKVYPQREPVDVLPVVGHPGVEVAVGAPAYLPPASEAGLDAQANHVARAVLCYLLGERRAWSDQAHLPANHVDQLGQFVQARPA